MAALFAASAPSGAQAATRIIDRTFVCPMVGVGYPDSVRFLRVSATPLQPAYDHAPEAYVMNGGGGSPSVSVGVRTGPGSGVAYTSGAVWLPPTRCTTTRVRVPLSAAGLQAGPADGTHYRCDVPASVFIRVRAVFKRATAFSRDPRFPTAYSIARGQIASGYVAVKTVRGRQPIFFASVHDSTGKERGFIAPSRCRPD